MPRDASRLNLIQSIVRHPALPALLGSMESRELAGVIGRVGLADAAELMELVPKRKLLRTLDDSIWKSPSAGAAERLDRDEFIGWLEVWNDIGEEFLIDRLEGIRDDYLAVLLGSVVQIGLIELVGDDGEGDDEPPMNLGSSGDHFGPFLVFPRVDDYEDVVRATLLALWTNAPERLLRLLGQLEPRETMLDRSGARAALEEDVRADRLRFREASGYVNAEDARTFLLYATVLSMEDIAQLRAYDESSARLLAAMAAEMPVTNPIEADTDDEEEHSPRTDELQVSTEPVADLRGLLERAELIDPPPELKLLVDLRESRQWTLEADLRTLALEDFAAFEQRMREVVYLANVLMAGVHLRGSSFDPQQAREAALAIASFGLQLLRKRSAGGGLREEPGLVRAFLAGWKTLQGIPRRVVDAFDTAALALEATSVKGKWLQEQVLSGVDDLREAVVQRRWDDARDAAIFLSIAFDSHLCRAAGALLDDLPRYPLAFMDEERTDMKWIESVAELETIARALAEIGR